MGDLILTDEERRVLEYLNSAPTDVSTAAITKAASVEDADRILRRLAMRGMIHMREPVAAPDDESADEGYWKVARSGILDAGRELGLMDRMVPTLTDLMFACSELVDDSVLGKDLAPHLIAIDEFLEQITVEVQRLTTPSRLAHVPARDPFDSLIYNLCAAVEVPIRKGRQPTRLHDLLSFLIKRVATDATGRAVFATGTVAPHFNSALAYLALAAFEPFLVRLVDATAAPLLAATNTALGLSRGWIRFRPHHDKDRQTVRAAQAIVLAVDFIEGAGFLRAPALTIEESVVIGASGPEVALLGERFGYGVRSRVFQAKRNEILLKCVAHNLMRLIEDGVRASTADFWGERIIEYPFETYARAQHREGHQP